MEKAWAIIIDDDQAACMMAIPRLFEQGSFRIPDCYVTNKLTKG
ncbi:hypothetical protein [Endozoicomonas atrinae]